MNLSQITTKNIKGFLLGNFRQFIRSNFPSYLPTHIEEQFLYRISIMNQDCLNNKQCPCSCAVPAKQIEDRACEKNCYPDMLDEMKWELFKEKNNINLSKVEQEATNRLSTLNK